MSRMTKHKGGRQFELFDRAEVPAYVPGLEHFERRARPHSTARPVLWEGMGSWVRQLASLPPSWQRSASQDSRFRKIARTLDVEKVRRSNDGEGLTRVEKWLADFRNNDLSSAFTRAELGALLVEVRNRQRLIELDRDQPKRKGPRFDPAKMPDDALDRLIQSHPSLELVELLRAERRRRASAAASAQPARRGRAPQPRPQAPRVR